jgi:23S rRNA (uracil1939-C5)-methyltransferase
MPYGEQLAAKRQKVVKALASYPRLAGLTVPQVIGAPRAFGYRNQVKLVARRTRRGLLLGVYRPGTHQVVDIAQCPVHHPLINQVLERLRTELERRDVPVYDERTGGGWLRYVAVRVSGWRRCAQVILVARDERWLGVRPLVQTLRRVRGVSGVVLNVNATTGNVIFGQKFRVLSGDETIVERVGGLKLMSRPGSFLQANIAAARRVYERVLAWAAPEAGETAVDLYTGVGAISFWLATRPASVWGVEESPLAVLDAKQNIRLNGFHNVRFLEGEAGTGMCEMTERLGKIDLVTLNPPRKGADDAVREAIVHAAPSRIVYVSCEPVSLARDLEWLAARDYVPVALQPFDMLPQTEHVETVVLLASPAWSRSA